MRDQVYGESDAALHISREARLLDHQLIRSDGSRRKQEGPVGSRLNRFQIARLLAPNGDGSVENYCPAGIIDNAADCGVVVLGRRDCAAQGNCQACGESTEIDHISHLAGQELQKSFETCGNRNKGVPLIRCSTLKVNPVVTLYELPVGSRIWICQKTPT